MDEPLVRLRGDCALKTLSHRLALRSMDEQQVLPLHRSTRSSGTATRGSIRPTTLA
jgi:hypothetical protein